MNFETHAYDASRNLLPVPHVGGFELRPNEQAKNAHSHGREWNREERQAAQALCGLGSSRLSHSILRVRIRAWFKKRGLAPSKIASTGEKHGSARCLSPFYEPCRNQASNNRRESIDRPSGRANRLRKSTGIDARIPRRRPKIRTGTTENFLKNLAFCNFSKLPSLTSRESDIDFITETQRKPTGVSGEVAQGPFPKTRGPFSPGTRKSTPELPACSRVSVACGLVSSTKANRS